MIIKMGYQKMQFISLISLLIDFYLILLNKSDELLKA